MFPMMIELIVVVLFLWLLIYAVGGTRVIGTLMGIFHRKAHRNIDVLDQKIRSIDKEKL